MSQTPPPETAASALAPSTPELQQLLHDAIQTTPDGIGIFDPDDCLIYCNAAFGTLFGLCGQRSLGMGFEQLVRHAHANGHAGGGGLNIETDDIDQWLAYALAQRRVQRYRSFQTDTCDGRWVQLTEQLTDSGHMFVFFTDITRQKRVEEKLQQLTGKLKVHADIDDLTGINNRRNFFRLAEKEIRRSRRGADDVTLLLLDVDHFKQVNDQCGHQQGDEVLRRICRALRAELRDYDILGRIGGEEFAVLIVQSGAAGAVEIAERLRKAVAAIDHGPRLQQMRPTLSIGIAANVDAALELNTLISRADKALYQAKGMGRNQCVRWNPAWC